MPPTQGAPSGNQSLKAPPTPGAKEGRGGAEDLAWPGQAAPGESAARPFSVLSGTCRALASAERDSRLRRGPLEEPRQGAPRGIGLYRGGGGRGPYLNAAPAASGPCPVLSAAHHGPECSEMTKFSSGL